MLYLKIINIFMKNIIYESYSKLYKELKNGIKIQVGQAVFKLWIKIVIYCSRSLSYGSK